MARRGRRPKPNKLKILDGTRADRIRPAAPSPPKSRPDCPDHLDEPGREAWSELVAALEQLGILSTVDAHALAVYCAAYSRWSAARKDIARCGVTCFTDNGSVKQNPACAVAAQAERMMAHMLAEFGLTPSSRSRIKAPAQTADDELDAFLKKKA